MARKTETAAKAPKTAKRAKAAKRSTPTIPLARDGAALAALRNDGKTWPEILSLANVASAIPLRVVLRSYLASDDTAAASAVAARKETVTPLTADAANVVAARDGSGEGFPLIAARTGLSVPAVRALYATGGGESADGRIYVARNGSRTLVIGSGPTAVRTALPPFSAKAAAKRAKAAAKATPVAKAAKADPAPVAPTAPTKAERKAAKAAKRERKAAKAAKRAKAAKAL